MVVDHGPLPAAQVMLPAWGIAHAPTDIHAANVVHRDLKPGNILLDESGPKVIDFGIVKSLTQSVTYRSHSTRIGTPLYMSPEQAMGRTVDTASDVFALGSTLYFLATGREAFAAENEWGVAHRIAADDPEVSVLAPPLRRLVVACLHKDPKRRPTPALVRTWCEEELGDAPGRMVGFTVAALGVAVPAAGMTDDSSYAGLLPGIVAFGLGAGIVFTTMWVAAASGVADVEQDASRPASTALQSAPGAGLAVLVSVGGIRTAVAVIAVGALIGLPAPPGDR
ncbi:bifunctional serine/threonine protein kinase/MFS transporter [Embleya sp. NPDC005575]|uniref:serine/threonine-protein kinase n=1 Tax=Embleya sp. NPDC005575 TaxID=3156892 RepID=UPI0033B3F47A